MKILVTGASGFLGRYVVPELVRRNVEVIASGSSESSGTKEWLKDVSFVSHAIGAEKEDPSELFSKFQQPDRIIHLAWSGLPNYTSMTHIEENLHQQYLFLKQLVAGGVKDVTVTGTCFEYGMLSGCLREDMPADPGNPYGIAKDSLRRFLQQLQSHIPFTLKWVRLFYMYGKGQSEKSLFSQLDKAISSGDEVFNMSGGEQVRDFLPVEDVAKNIVDISMNNKEAGIVNCCSGEPVKVKDFVQHYLDARDSKMKLNLGFYPYAQYEPMEFWGDNTKLKRAINR